MSSLALYMAVAPPPPVNPDLWARWFFRLVQLVGLGLGVHEAFGHGRLSTYLFSSALILGAEGARVMLRVVFAVAQSVATAEEADKPHKEEA